MPTFGNQPKSLRPGGVIEHTSSVSPQTENLLENCESPGNLERSTIPFTAAKIKDQLITELALATIYSKDEKNGITYILSKYYEKAAFMMFRIPVYQPVPPFEIAIEDLSLQLKHELADLGRSDQRMFHYIVKMAVVHIFENIHFEYFHSSVMRFLKVEFVKAK